MVIAYDWTTARRSIDPLAIYSGIPNARHTFKTTKFSQTDENAIFTSGDTISLANFSLHGDSTIEPRCWSSVPIMSLTFYLSHIVVVVRLSFLGGSQLGFNYTGEQANSSELHNTWTCTLLLLYSFVVVVVVVAYEALTFSSLMKTASEMVSDNRKWIQVNWKIKSFLCAALFTSIQHSSITRPGPRRHTAHEEQKHWLRTFRDRLNLNVYSTQRVQRAESCNWDTETTVTYFNRKGVVAVAVHQIRP